MKNLLLGFITLFLIGVKGNAQDSLLKSKDIEVMTDLIMKNSSAEILVSDKWAYDAKKVAFALARGYTVKVIWEQHLKTMYSIIEEELVAYASSKN